MGLKIFKKKKVNYREMFEHYEQDLFGRVVDECIKKSTDLTNIKISRVIEFHNRGFTIIKLKRYTYKDDETIIKEKTFSLRGLPELIIEKESIIEGIRKYFVEER